jgi:hypothetical protein
MWLSFLIQWTIYDWNMLWNLTRFSIMNWRTGEWVWGIDLMPSIDAYFAKHAWNTTAIDPSHMLQPRTGVLYMVKLCHHLAYLSLHRAPVHTSLPTLLSAAACAPPSSPCTPPPFLLNRKGHLSNQPLVKLSMVKSVAMASSIEASVWVERRRYRGVSV